MLYQFDPTYKNTITDYPTYLSGTKVKKLNTEFIFSRILCRVDGNRRAYYDASFPITEKINFSLFINILSLENYTVDGSQGTFFLRLLEKVAK